MLYLFQTPFQLHLLGVFTLPDRFIIAYMERVFERYLALESINMGVTLTYDSTNYEHQSNYHCRELPTCTFNNGRLDIFQDIHQVPDHILRKVYYTEELYHHVLNEKKRLKQNNPHLTFVGSFLPMSLHAHVAMDRFIEHVIKKYDLVDILFKYEDFVSFVTNIDTALEKVLKNEPKVFGKRFKKTVMDNFVKLHRLHKWWTQEGNKYKSLAPIIHNFITMIDAPGKLM